MQPQTGSSGAGSSATVLINREQELGELRASLDAALSGSGRVVLIEMVEGHGTSGEIERIRGRR